MFDAGALCLCGSHDVRLITQAYLLRPLFGCGSCQATWTSGNAGHPYMQFARKDPDWAYPQ